MVDGKGGVCVDILGLDVWKIELTFPPHPHAVRDCFTSEVCVVHVPVLPKHHYLQDLAHWMKHPCSPAPLFMGTVVLDIVRKTINFDEHKARDDIVRVSRVVWSLIISVPSRVACRRLTYTTALSSSISTLVLGLKYEGKFDRILIF